MQNNEQMPESIWADGIPENIKDEDKISNEQLVIMAVDHIVKTIIIPKGFKLEQGFPRKDFPNIICKKDGVLYTITVIPSVYPNFVALNDDFRLQIVDISNKINATALFAPVGYRSVDEERAKAQLVLRGDVFQTAFPGFVVLTDEPNQDIRPVNNKLFRP